MVCSNKYSNRTKFLDGNPEDIFYYQGTRETMVDTTLIKLGEGIMREALVTSTKEAAEVASEDELTDTSEGALTYRTVYLLKVVLTKELSAHHQIKK